MESFSRINNALIKAVDSEAEPYNQLPRPLKNSLKTQIVAPITRYEGSNTLFSARGSLDIDRRFDNLAQLFVKFTIDVEATTGFTVKPYTACRILREISIRTKGNNYVLQTISPEYSIMRVDELIGTPLNSRLEACINPPASFSETTGSAEARQAVIYLPLFLWFSESPNVFLNTRNLQDLTINYQTAASVVDMGFSSGVVFSSLNMELVSVYHDLDNSYRNANIPQAPKLNMVRSLKGNYGTFYEDSIMLGDGATKAKMLLRCPYPAFALHVSLVKPDTKDRATIKNLKLTLKGNKFLNLDTLTNFQMYSKDQKGYVEAEAFSYWFSINKDRSVDSGLITASPSDNMSPMFLEIEFDALTVASGEDYVMRAFWEHRGFWDVDEFGNIMIGQPSSEILFNNSNDRPEETVGNEV